MRLKHNLKFRVKSFHFHPNIRMKKLIIFLEESAIILNLLFG